MGTVASRETDAILNRAQAIAKVGSWRLDVRRELHVSDQAYRNFGLRPGARLTPKTLLRRVHPGDRQWVRRCWSAALRGEAYDIEYRIIVDAGILWIREKAEQEIDDHGMRGCLGIVQDITERKRLEEELRLSVQARDEVLAIVAHDLRNPLNTIVMHAAVLRLLPEDHGQRVRSTDGIDRAANRMTKLIQDLLDVSSLDAGCLSMEPARVSVGQVMFELGEAHKAPLAAASLHLQLEGDRDLPEICADRARVLQVFENLIGNSVKFSRPGGRIVIRAARRNSEVLFLVSDTGTGIAPEHVPHLFDRFWQARATERRGAGLGLAIVKGIVEAHGGRIWVESTPGEGSAFSFTIPAASRD